MDSRAVLAEHPSVQDLDIRCDRVNSAKVNYNTHRINAGPFYESGPRITKKEAKGQTTKVVRHEQNLVAAANRPRSDVAAYKSKATTSTKQPVGARVAGTPVSGGSRPPSRASTSTPSLPPLPKSPTASQKPKSALTSVVSYEGTDAESFSMYSCSCCQIHPPSSIVTGRLTPVPSVITTSSHCSVNPSDYDNMTSISQRIAKEHRAKKASAGEHRHHRHHHGSQAGSASVVTVASTKLREIEAQLEQEREDRRRTHEELKQIQQRQELLMSKLSDREKELFAEALTTK